jgi:hypothetical protein
VANPRKRSSLSEAFGDVSSRTSYRTKAEVSGTETPVGESKRHKPETGDGEMVPVKGGRLVAADTPVNMTFTVTAKERYEWSLELRRRGLSAVSVLREAMNELLVEGPK